MKILRLASLLVLLLAAALPVCAQTFTQKDKEAVIQAAHQAVGNDAAVVIQKAANNYARVQVSKPGTDPAKIYLHKTNGRWKVIAGPGTSFSPQELKQAGVPPSVR